MTKPIDEYGFDIGEFRYRVAALVKYVIRARERFEPGFLGEVSVYDSWHVKPIPTDQVQPAVLLEMAARVTGQILEQMIDMGGSGGVTPDDPLGDLKMNAAAFADGHALNEAAAAVRNGATVEWAQLVEWDSLPDIRQALDKLPHPSNPMLRDDSGGTPDGPHPPSFFFWNGVRKKELTGLPFKLVSRLWFAKNSTVRIDELAESVWGDNRMKIKGSKLNSVRSRANHFFEKHAIPRRVKITGDYISLVKNGSVPGTSNGQ